MFLVNVPVVVLGLVLAVRLVPETRSQHPEPVDGPGTALLAVSLLTPLAPLTEGRAAGRPLWTWLSLAAFPFAAGAFGWWSCGRTGRGARPGCRRACSGSCRRGAGWC
ncbi:hypothetical protein Shyhy01_15560 [Streptomyces hygroscopicus subsp. hygroscopicus]|nr:hypothetical protein Shyhy01_15560 [Streptomyces hygroscopicus subsp. hygroscopicus]